MRTGQLRLRYWALDDAGHRIELLATVEQGPDGRFDEVFSADPRPLLAVLELRDGTDWREVRTRAIPGGAPRVLPVP
jgi:hypothetical protein